MLGLLLSAAERGYLPDRLLRLGIRQLLKERLRTLNTRDSEAFIGTLRNSPIALVTDLANEQHYEIPARFFELTLGDLRKYSSGLWEQAKSLSEAESEMLDLKTRRAEITDNMDVLDLGCGWGSFLLFAAAKFPSSTFTGVSNSSSQREFILSQCEVRGLKNIKVLTADMNTFQSVEKYDRIISVEMFEHMRNYERLLERIASWLKPNGKFFLHIFTHKEFTYPFESEGQDNWMGRYFFSGGMMPAHLLPSRFQKDLNLKKSWEVSGTHYSKTCEAWLEKQDRNELEIRKLFQETYGNKAGIWFNRWRIFFLACSELFAFNGGDEWFVSHYLFTKARNNA